MWETCCGFEELAISLGRSFKQTSRTVHCRVLLASSLQSLLLGANSANLRGKAVDKSLQLTALPQEADHERPNSWYMPFFTRLAD